MQLKIPNKEDEKNASLIQCKFFAVEWLMAEVFSFFFYNHVHVFAVEV